MEGDFGGWGLEEEAGGERDRGGLGFEVGIGRRPEEPDARLVRMGEEWFGGRVVKFGSAALATVVFADPELRSETTGVSFSSMTTSGTSEEEIWLVTRSLEAKVVESVVDWEITVEGTVTEEARLEREGERGGYSARKEAEGGSGGSGGAGGGPPGVDDAGFRMAARPDEESQGFSLEAILYHLQIF